MKKNKLKKKKLEDVKIIKTKIFNDNRGKFNKVFSNELYPFLKTQNSFIKEVNYCITNQKGTIRGMHFQSGPFKEDKIVTCLNGEIYDVVVDLRKNSKSFLSCKSFILNEKKNHSLFIPKGFAHGYQSITDNTVVLYFMSKEYVPKYSDGINPLSNLLKIKWPIGKKIISIKDKNLPHLKSEFKGL